MLTDSIEKSAETYSRKMICESCGEEFSCGVESRQLLVFCG
jgi:hypothetical protein